MQEKIIALIKDLVRIPSISSDIKKLEYIISHVKQLFEGIEGVHVFERRYNEKPSLIIQNFSGQHADIVLSGHLDVVPVQDLSLFEPYEKDGKLYGRGCGDMKDGCAIMILLMKEILEQGWTEKNVSLWLTTDEETGGQDGVGALVADGWSSDVVLIPDAGAYDYVTYASKGIITVNIRVQGKAAHSSRPRKGQNALEKAFALYTTLKNTLCDASLLTEENRYRGTTVEMTVCNGGIAHNVLPECADIAVNIRYTEAYTEEQVWNIIEKQCAVFDAIVIDKDSGPIMFTDTDHPVLQKFLSIVEDVTGTFPELHKEHGTTDGRYFDETTTVLLYQPTDDHIHTSGEFTTVDQLENVYTVYKNFIMESAL